MRAPWVDNLRGLAVVWMVIFHASYDLRMLQYVDWDFSRGFWYAFPRIIAFTFLFCVGLSLNFTHAGGVRWSSLKDRGIKLGAAAILISVSTYLAFPSNWIYFGTLHCILLGSFLGAPLVTRRTLAWALLLLILLGQYVLSYDIRWVSSILRRPSLDFIPIYPWFWAILAGMLTGPHLSKIKFVHNFPELKWLSFLGRHSLKIYLLHQPLIYGLLWAAKSLYPA